MVTRFTTNQVHRRHGSHEWVRIQEFLLPQNKAHSTTCLLAPRMVAVISQMPLSRIYMYSSPQEGLGVKRKQYGRIPVDKSSTDS